MTAGLHHRWRERAADLARVGPGRPGARRRDGHRRPGDRARAPRRAERRGRRLGLLGGDARRARARRRRELRWEWANALELPYADDGVRRRHRRLRRAQLLRPRARAGRDGARRAPGRPRGRARDHDARRSRRCRRSSRLWFDRIVPLLGRLPATEAYTLPAELGQALPRPAGARRRCMRRRGLRDVRWILTAGGIIALHVGSESPDGQRRGRRRGRRGRRRARPAS